MPRMSGVVKNEGEYELQMGCGGQLATATLRPLPATARCSAGCRARQQAARAGGVMRSRAVFKRSASAKQKP